jgi:pyrroloquinoline-quinone synthase
MDVIARIDNARRRWNVLEHSFYRRWSAGELSVQELARYSEQYRHAVLALAGASRALAEKAPAEHRAGLERHAVEEASHVELWDEFATAARAAAADGVEVASGSCSAADVRIAGGSSEEPPLIETASCEEPPLIETASCAQAWAAGEDALEHLAVLYAIEASQPEIAKTKLEGLLERYGYTAEGPATEYFRLHTTLDVEHAGQARELIDTLLDRMDAARARECGERMLARAEAALEGNWELLDGVERQYAQTG